MIFGAYPEWVSTGTGNIYDYAYGDIKTVDNPCEIDPEALRKIIPLIDSAHKYGIIGHFSFTAKGDALWKKKFSKDSNI